MWDGLALFWVAFWLVVGVWAGYQIYQLTGLTDSVASSGHALQTAGQALRNLADVPIVGDRTRQLGRDVTTTADGIVVSGGQARASVSRLSVLLGTTIALGPATPVLLFYLPMRLLRRREVREVRTALNEHDADPALDAILAERAVANLPLRDLLAVSADPYGDLRAGRHDDLAQAELTRLGLRWVQTSAQRP